MAVAAQHSTLTLTLWVLLGVGVLLVALGLLRRSPIGRRREPLVVRMIRRASDRVVETVKEPLTIAILEDVADVLKTGNYTQNIADALAENREQIKRMVAEKLKSDPTAGRISRVPFHDQLIDQASETTLRVVFEMLADPRTDELISDLLRDNLTQIRQAIEERRA